MSKPTKRKASPPDPWSDPPPMDSGLRRDPEDPLAFWEWECQRWHFREHIHVGHRKGLAKPFWERIKSCEPLKVLCKKHKAALLHPVFFLLREIHAHPFFLTHRPPGRKFLKQQAMSDLRNLRGAKQAVDRTPNLPSAEKAIILKGLAKAEVVALDQVRNPGLRVDLRTNLGLGGQEEMVLSWRRVTSSQAGRPTQGYEELLNANLFLLSESVRHFRKHYWLLVMELVEHFCLTVFPVSSGPESVRTRVNLFKRTHRDRLDTLRDSLSERVTYLLTLPTDIL